MMSVISSFSGVPTSGLDMTDTLAPFLGSALIGLFLMSVAGIVFTVLVDRWSTRQQLALAPYPGDIHHPVHHAARA